MQKLAHVEITHTLRGRERAKRSPDYKRQGLTTLRHLLESYQQHVVT